MGDNIVKLVFKAGSEGFEKVIGQTQTLQGKLGKLAQGAGILGSAFGSLGNSIGRAFGMFLQGGIWGAAAEVFKMLIEKTGVFKQTVDSSRASLEELKRHFETVNKKYAESISSIDKETERKKKIIELTKEQTKAELDLALAKAKAAGNDAKAIKLSEQIAKSEEEAKKKTEKLTVEQAEARLKAAMRLTIGLPHFDKEGNFDRKSWDEQRRSYNGKIFNVRKEINNLENATPTQDELGTDRGASWATMRNQKVKDLRDRISELQEAKNRFTSLLSRAVDADKKIKEAKQLLADARKVQATEEVRGAVSVVAAKVAARDEAIKKVQAEAQTNAALAQTSAKAPGAYAARFASAFDLWRDPAAAQQAQDAARAKTDDLKRFQKSVDRYGGKWRIDEAARLMREGDETGLQERLAEWRKSAKFNGQTEQMVLAAAAKQNEHSAERSLADIQKTSIEINQKLEAIKAAFEGGDE